VIKRLLKVVKNVLGESITEAIRPLGHGTKSLLAAAYYGFPARKLTIVGITGTKGKTSTTIYTGRLLNLSGVKSGYISTALMYTGGDAEQGGNPKPFEETNIYKMTSLDGVVLHRSLREMVNNGCSHVVIELSSQGLVQNRHWGLGSIDIGVFLNIFPEHLEAHGGWDNYVKAKSILFQNLDKKGVFIAQARNEHSEIMWNAIPNKSLVTKQLITKGRDYSIRNDSKTSEVLLTYNQKKVPNSFSTKFEALNSAFALSILQSIKRKEVTAKELQHISKITEVPGRMEWVLKNKQLLTNTKSIVPKSLHKVDILVDYAHEPESMKQLLETLHRWKKSTIYSHVIHILSCDGAGRDDWKKPVMGDISFINSDYIVLTTDNYTQNDDPQDIVNLLSHNYPPEEEGSKYIKEINRRKAFKKALHYSAQSKEPCIIVSTGVGSEYGLTQPGGVMTWNEPLVWQNLVEEFEIQKKRSKTKASKKTTVTKKSRKKA
jgi:UDP-N-acetylmuramoyl-L-alanyl-D-glutamate--2,6-diaminopimelate ligase